MKNQQVNRVLADSGSRISVVIPTFNRAGTLDRALQSVLAQTHPANEIIVVDDGSVDTTRKIIDSKYRDSVRYFYQSNSGVSAARNAGIKSATGNWIAFLDSDDEWMPEKLESQLSLLSEHPDYQFCHSDEIWIRNGKRVNAMLKHEKSGGFIFEKCLPLCVISPSSALIKRTVFDEIGLFDEKLPACEDYEYWLRYCSNNPVLYIDKPLLVKYGGHSDQLSRKHKAMDLFRLRALVKLMSSVKLTADQVKSVSEIFSAKYEILVKGAKKHANQEMLHECELLAREMQKYFKNSDALL